MSRTLCFLYGELQPSGYVQMIAPKGFERYLQVIPGNVLHLRKSLYGLRNAPRIFKEHLDSSLREFGLIRLEDGCWAKPTSDLRVFVYVDDLLISAPSHEELNELLESLKTVYKIEAEPLHRVIGIQLEWLKDSNNNSCLFLHQKDYINEMVSKFETLTQSNLVHGKNQVPLVELLHKNKLHSVSANESQASLYASFIASALFASICTRVDIAYAVA